MTLRLLCLLLIGMLTSPLLADDQPADSPQTPPPAAANATVEVAAPDKPGQSESPTSGAAAPSSSAQQAQPPVTDKIAQSKIIEQRVDALLKDPGPMIDRAAVQTQLDDLTTNAYELSNIAADPQVRFDALNLQLQSIYTRLIEYPDAPDVDRQLGRLRAAARRIKTVNLPLQDTSGVGDFWLMTAELYDMNRTKLPLDARKKQAVALMKDFLAKHPDWPAAMDVREAMEQMEKKPVDTSRASQEQNVEPASAPAPTHPQ